MTNRPTDETWGGEIARFQTLIEISSDLMWEINLEGTFIYVNLRVKDLLGYDVDEIIGKSAFDLMSENEARRSRAFFEEKNKTPKPFSEWPLTLLHKDGHQVIVEVNAAPIHDSDRRLSSWHGLLKNITKRMFAEEALRKSEERFRSLVELSSDWVWEADKNGIFTFADPKIKDFLGYTPAEVMGRSFTNFMPEKEAEKAALLLKESAVRLSPLSMVETTQIHRDGRQLVIETSAVPIFDTDKSLAGWRGINKDITKHKRESEEKTRLQTQVQQARKKEAIGTLAGGIAHEFNNAIVAVTGNIELLQMDLPDDQNIRRYTESMKASAYRMTRLTNQLLAYAGGGKYRTKTISLNDFVEETLPIIQHSISPKIRLETNLTNDRLDINVDITQMQMVFSAVLSNASEAIEGKGKIRISTNIENITEEQAKANPEFRPVPYICLSVEDNGKGMNEETRSKIFEPFFTTKFQGRGLGMAAVYGVIRNHGGAIIVDSEPNKGTRVRIYLPAVRVESKKIEAPGTETATSSGTILIIEDDEIVMDVTRAMLEKLGYQILMAGTGKQATDIAYNFNGPIDLALLDIKLPDMDGGMLYPLIKNARPNLKVIVCSGYAIDSPAQEIMDAGADGFFQKPFSFKILSEKLKELLNTR